MKQTSLLVLLGLVLGTSALAVHPELSSVYRLDESRLAEYTGTGWWEAACAFGTGAGIPLAVGGLVASSLLLGVPGVVLAIGGGVCMAVL